MHTNIKIPICKPSLPSKEDYQKKIEHLWDDHMLSNFARDAMEMENIIRDYLDTKNVIIISNADAGLILALSVLGLEKDSEVIVPSFTFNSTVNAVSWNHLTPVFADIDIKTFCIDPADVERKITKKTRAILATHVFGNPCDIAQLETISKKHNLTLIFDAAQAYGATYNGGKIGTFGDMEIFSFSGTKVVTSAEGGAIVVRSTKTKDLLLKARNYGFLHDYNSEILGINGKISEFNAALGCLTLPNIDNEIAVRNLIAQQYKLLLSGVGDISFQEVQQNSVSTYKDFAIITKKRDELADFLALEGIQTKKYFYPIHTMTAYNHIKSDLPTTKSVSAQCLCIPIYNDITHKELYTVVRTIQNFFH